MALTDARNPCGALRQQLAHVEVFIPSAGLAQSASLTTHSRPSATDYAASDLAAALSIGGADPVSEEGWERATVGSWPNCVHGKTPCEIEQTARNNSLHCSRSGHEADAH